MTDRDRIDRPLRDRRRHQRRRHRARRRRPRALGRPVREGRSGGRHLVAIGQARAWRPALPGILRVPAGARGADRARSSLERGPAYHLADALRACRTAPTIGPRGSFGSGSSSTITLEAARSCPARGRSISPRDPEGLPLLDRYTRGFEYSDCWVDDARLVVLNAVDAAERGAQVLTRSAAVSARRRTATGPLS